MSQFLQDIPFPILIVACLTLGLAPFVPQPHLVEKLQMLSRGELKKLIDWFDLFMHGTPWALLFAKSLLVLNQYFSKS